MNSSENNSSAVDRFFRLFPPDRYGTTRDRDGVRLKVWVDGMEREVFVSDLYIVAHDMPKWSPNHEEVARLTLHSEAEYRFEASGEPIIVDLPASSQQARD